MLLQRLIVLADYLEQQDKLAPPLYGEKWVRYVIELANDGHLLNPRPIDLSTIENGQKGGQRRVVPDIVRAAGIKPILLADNAEYTFGLGRENTKPERIKQCHTTYMELLEECALQTNDPIAITVLAFLRNNPLEYLNLDEAYNRGGVIIFRVGDRFAHRQTDIQKFWAAYHTPSKVKMQCIVCGEEKPVLERLQAKIKGIPGGQASGTALISANKPAFESYGLEKSYIAPTCMDCGDRFTKALDYLLHEDDSHLRFSNLVFAFWTQEPAAGFTISSWYDNPEPQAVKELLNAVRSGKWDPTVDETPFYAVSLSSSGGRAAVRDWIDTTVGRVKACLADWFQGQLIVGAWGEEPLPFKIYALAAATVRELKDVPPPTYRILLHSGITGTPLPWNILQQAIHRNQAERTVTRSRAALIKLVMTTQHILKEDYMVQLQIEHPDPAYHCGRLLAVLESIQRSALPNVTATIVDRFYGAASTAPVSVFGRLVRGAQPHLTKLRRDRPATGYALQDRLEEVLAALPSFPRVLDLKQQGLFALGYYHQRAYDRSQARAYSASKGEVETES